MTLSLNLEEIKDIILILEEINKAIQINIDENLENESEELISLIRQNHQKSVVTHKIYKKSIFKPLKKPKKIFVKVLKNDFIDIQNTQNTNLDSKKTTASNTMLKCGNNAVNMTEKVNY